MCIRDRDYVTKPFPMSVFQKKLSVVLGRLVKQSGGGDSYEDGALSINFSEMTASLSGKPLVFTPLEYRLLKIMTKNPQNVLTRQVLLEKLWDADGNFVDEHALTAAISRVDVYKRQEWEQYIRQASLESSAAMKPVMEAIAPDFGCCLCFGA